MKPRGLSTGWQSCADPARVAFVGLLLEDLAAGHPVREDERTADVLAGLIAAGLVLERKPGLSARLELTARGRRALAARRDAAAIHEDLDLPGDAAAETHLRARDRSPTRLAVLFGAPLLGLVLVLVLLWSLFT